MFDTRRKDFWEMFLHHLVAVPLISFGWVCNIHRMGSLIMVIHDAADIFLEFAKSLKYAKFSKACDITFLIFVIVWIITRLMIYPRLLFVTFFRTLLPAYPVYYLLNSLLSIVLFLHIYWTYLIYKVLYDVITKGSVQKDERSSSEETDENDKYLEENDKLKS
jgi:sphingoid base N-palmitoyltransferase